MPKWHFSNMLQISEFVKFRFGYSNAHAAATASLAQVLPVFLMPILGICLDRYGKRTWMSKLIYISYYESVKSLTLAIFSDR